MALIGSASDTVVKSAPFSQYMASIEGMQLIEAMLKIEASDIRRSLIALAEMLGDPDPVQTWCLLQITKAARGDRRLLK